MKKVWPKDRKTIVEGIKENKEAFWLGLALILSIGVGVTLLLSGVYETKSTSDKEYMVKTITTTKFQTKENFVELKKKSNKIGLVKVKYKGQIYNANVVEEPVKSKAKLLYRYNLIKYKGKLMDPNKVPIMTRIANNLFDSMGREDEVIINTSPTTTPKWQNPNQ
ncbi:hypothetical protein [Lactobacillus johnsonii]|uniref:Uncharacterized protein n=1 Tax=Lactobacillus johnsonii TaxID=33959 RepID=A0A9X7XVG3_LACJH|nr:hypothetical protein [Lactobacillus johnsonii]QIA88488.1 hypothetical protein FEE39_09570 [Lactobacillus johnsonii]